MRWGWLLVVGLAGCEPMSEPGGIGAVFSPVEVKKATTASSTATPAPEPARPVDEEPFFEPKTVHVPADPVQSPPAPTPPAPGTATEPTSAVVDLNVEGGGTSGTPPEASSTAPAAVEPQLTPKATVTQVPASSSLGGTGWPLRLIKTLPDTQPPRAILGLPSGEEIVISPGKMLPEHGLVVMSVGPNSAELAYITPAGDYAAVRSVSLTTQY